MSLQFPFLRPQNDTYIIDYSLDGEKDFLLFLSSYNIKKSSHQKNTT